MLTILSLNYLAFGKIEVRVRAQLSAAIFAKALRLDDVKNVDQSDSQKSKIQISPSVQDEDEPSEGDALLKKPKSDNTSSSSPMKKLESKTQQQVTNLIAVDTVRISEMASHQHAFLGSFISFTVALIFLVRLVGWLSFSLGLLVPIIMIPLNARASRAYGGAQRGIMQSRDKRLRVLAEVLQGIKQIKFTATEAVWEEGLNGIRDQELRMQRTSFLWQLTLRLLWIASPVMLAAVTLTVYVLLQESLSPAVAFTALGVFANLEFAVSVLPMATLQFLDALVSVKRVEKFLRALEKKENTIPGHIVQLDRVSISWPATDDQDGTGGHTLRDLNLEFPNSALR